MDISDEAVDAVTTALTSRTSDRSARDKYTRCPVSDLDLSACERCTPSYVRLPADYPAYTFTARCAALLLLVWGVESNSGRFSTLVEQEPDTPHLAMPRAAHDAFRTAKNGNTQQQTRPAHLVWPLVWY
jgi:hypothetical protein